MKRFIACAAILAATAACAPKEDTAAKPADSAAGAAMSATGPSGPNAGAAPAPVSGNMSVASLEGPAAGQWELTSETMGRAMPPTKVCYGKMSVSDLQKTQQKAGVACSEQKVDKTADGYNMHSVCKSEATGGTTTSDVKVSGDLKTAYTMEVHMKMDPPPPGMAGMDMKISAKRLGDCEAGQVPLVPGAAN